MNYHHKGFPDNQAETMTLVNGLPKSAMYANMQVHPTKVMQDNMLADGERKQL